eukprot:941934-Pelagomonas_calceolata.AAC.1
MPLCCSPSRSALIPANCCNRGTVVRKTVVNPGIQGSMATGPNGEECILSEMNHVFYVKSSACSPAQYPPEYKLSFKELSETFAGPFCAQLKLAVEREVSLSASV